MEQAVSKNIRIPGTLVPRYTCTQVHLYQTTRRSIPQDIPESDKFNAVMKEKVNPLKPKLIYIMCKSIVQTVNKTQSLH